MWAVPGPRVLFEPYLIGGKAPTFDYIVYLLDASGHRSGPFFFVQVKTTDQRPQPGDPYPIKFTATDVARAIATKVPFFLCVVDRSAKQQARMFVRGVDSKRTKGISRVAARHDLTTDAVKIAIYDEVERLWKTQGTPALSVFI